MPKHDPTRERSLAKCRQWEVWLNHNLASLPADTGLVHLIRDTLIVLHHNATNCARRLRGNPGWDIQGTMRDDTVRLEDEARENLAHFKNHHRREEIPVKLAPLVDLLEGALNAQIRLAREIDEIRETGALELEVTTDKATSKIIEARF